MRSFIFITGEGTTLQPDSESPEQDIENCQVIGFSKGKDEKEAFLNLIKENKYLLGTTFDEVICMELKYVDYYAHSKYFYLEEHKKPDLT